MSDCLALSNAIEEAASSGARRLDGLIVVVVGVLFAALRHWPVTAP